MLPASANKRTVSRVRAAALVLLLLTGCGGPPSLSGSVTLNGAPLADAIIVLTPEEEGAVLVVGATRADGRFLITPAAGKTIARGKYKMTISKREQTPEQARKMLPGNETIPERYSHPTKTELTVTVPTSGDLRLELTR
jgi:hypothetical protein